MEPRRYNLRERKGSGDIAERKPRLGKIQVVRDGETSGRGKETHTEEERVKKRSVRKGKSSKSSDAETEQSPDERAVRGSRAPEQTLPTPRSEGPKGKDIPFGRTSIPRIEIWPSEANHSNRLPLDETIRSTDHTILEPPFEYTSPTKPKTRKIRDPSEVNPEFSRVLEYVPRKNEESSYVKGFPTLAKVPVASRSISRSRIPASEQGTSAPLFPSEHSLASTTTAETSQALDMQEIVPGLFLGSFVPTIHFLTDRCHVFHPSKLASFRAVGIRRILTLRQRHETREAWETESFSIIKNDPSIKIKWSNIADSPGENLLTTELIPRITEKIRKSILSNKSVFVYSHLGRSRSVTMVLAYLMKYHHMDFDAAFNYVRSKRSGIDPNPGFVQQLLVWNFIKYNWNNRCRYAAFQHWERAYRNRSVTCNYDEFRGRTILLPNAPLQRDFAPESSHLLSGTAVVQQETKDGYFCSNCGYHLAPQDASFGFTKEHGESCTQVFLGYDMKWMEVDPEAPGGKLLCPGCGVAVGEYAWLGLQCEDCGEVVSPGLALVKRGNVGLKKSSERDGMGLGVSNDQDMDVESDQFLHDQETPATRVAAKKEEVKSDLGAQDLFISELHGVQQMANFHLFRRFSAPGPRGQRPIPRPIVIVPCRRGFDPLNPSPLRNEWFPRSAFSLQSNSQEPQASDQLSTSTNNQDNGNSGGSGSQTASDGEKMQIDEWNNSPANLPWTAVDELEMAPEFM